MLQILTKIFTVFAIALLIAFFTNSFANQDNGDLNQNLLVAMEAYHVPVVGYAIIKNYKIIAADTLSIDPNIKVSTSSLFQAASISKSITTYGALKLVSQNKFSLDESANDFLTSWKIPSNEYNRNDLVTAREILDMTSGLSVSGFPGYAQDQSLPMLLQILNGQSPANTSPVEVFYKPGSKYFYSGGGFQVLQQLIEDITHQSYSSWIQKEVLGPLNMKQSVFQTPLSKKLTATAAPGFLSDNTMIKGGWNNYPELSAAGLWTTPTDLANFAISVTNAYLGKDNTMISKSIAEQMLTRQKNTDYGLGFVISGNGKNLNFRKGGANQGYHCRLIMFPNTGDGFVIMTDSDNGVDINNYMTSLVALKYHWLYYFPYFDEGIAIP